MFSIKKWPTKLGARTKMIKAVADIESIVQPQDAWTERALTDLLKQDSIDLMVVSNDSNSAVVGYCLYQVLFEQAEILRIGTHPQFQRHGIASQLFIALNKELQDNKVEILLLEVRADNDPAIALYQRQGLVIIHRRKGYYSQPQQPAIDALIMQRSVTVSNDYLK
jgi:ribosomal-protein-alanine N-acetyltransferase